MINLHDLPMSVAKTTAQDCADTVLADVVVPPMEGFK